MTEKPEGLLFMYSGHLPVAKVIDIINQTNLFKIINNNGKDTLLAKK